MTRDDIVGVYRQLGDDLVGADGRIIESDTDRSSQIMYSPDGYIGVIATPNGRRKPAGAAGRTDLAGATPEELAEVTRTVTCYAGRYELKDGVVHHYIDMALNPHLMGQTLIRRVDINGPDLTLSSLPDARGQYRRIRWRRVGAKG